MTTVELYTREQCHLCHEALTLLERVRADVPFDLKITDIDADAVLRARYDWEVPVVMVDGRLHAKLRVDENAFRRRLALAQTPPEVE